METKRQQQVNKLIQVALSDIFQKEAKEILGNALVTVSSIRITPDLYTARVNLSIYNVANPDELLAIIQLNTKEIRGLLSKRIRNKMRSMPELVFYRDDTMDTVIQLDSLMKVIKEKDDKIKELRDNSDFVDTNPYKED
ncbi:MAG: ribosome-binding factor A [Chitinophagales bacterium]|nr:ribosome-binding factor A [Chitinophagales bacterium]MCZ2394585.1 ribosome-binding factor A [Chitinophagales bacterium]